MFLYDVTFLSFSGNVEFVKFSIVTSLGVRNVVMISSEVLLVDVTGTSFERSKNILKKAVFMKILCPVHADIRNTYIYHI